VRHFIIWVGFGLLGIGLIGCGDKATERAKTDAIVLSGGSDRLEEKRSESKDGKSEGLPLGADWADDGPAPVVSGAGPARGPVAKGKESTTDSALIPHSDSAGPLAPLAAPKSPPVAKSDPGVADPVAGTATRPKKQSEPVPPAGILTAGSFDDNLDPLVFASFTRRFDIKRWQDQLPDKLSGTRVQVLVKDPAGRPVGGARVRLSAGNKTASEELITRSLGQATFVLTWDNLPSDEELSVHVVPPDGSAAVAEKIPVGAPRWEVTLPAAQAKLPKNLDLALVLDTTGSMGDELKYLLGEFKGISADIKAKFPEVSQRLGLVLYRDVGDEYVTRMFDFTTSIDEFHRNLSKQSAAGGGDAPEAVHKGLEQVQQLRWRSDADTVRIVFLIGDAPPHTQHMSATMKAVNVLRKDGIAIYPVACSGYDEPCELIWRAAALLTSSQFLFLTDDSGVGGAHAEPKIPYYQVEHLNKLMVRMVASELTGARLAPLPNEVIRTVGRKIN
jgi:hypothetical protein